MKNKPHSYFGVRSRRGFTLVELLSVIAIIGLLSAVAMVGFNSINRGAGTRGAADLAASVVLSARVEALSMGLGSMVAVDNGSDPERQLRRLAVFRRVPSPDGASEPVLQLVGKPLELPRNVYFLTGYSSGYTEEQAPFPDGDTAVLAFNFNSNGHLTKPSSAEDIRMVFGQGPLEGGSAPAGLLDTRAGILLRVNGRPTFFTSPEQMPPSS